MNPDYQAENNDALVDLVDALRDDLRSVRTTEDARRYMPDFRKRVAVIKAELDASQADHPPEHIQTISHIHGADICGMIIDIPTPERYEYLDVLLEHGATLNRKTFPEENLMTLAVERGDMAMIEYVAEKGYKFGEPVDPEGNGLIQYAAAEGSACVIRWLFDRGERIDSGLSPLFAAVEYEHANCIRLLMELGADSSAQNPSDQTPAEFAVETGKVVAFEALIDFGAVPRRPNLDYYIAESDKQSVFTDLLLQRPRLEASQDVARAITPRAAARSPKL